MTTFYIWFRRQSSSDRLPVLIFDIMNMHPFHPIQTGLEYSENHKTNS